MNESMANSEGLPETNQKLKDVAFGYLQLGINVVPILQKKPLVKWEQWQTQRQTEKEFECLPWDQVDGFGVICGTQLKNELYLCAIDFDVKNVSEEAMEKGKLASKELPVTMTERTPSGGFHHVYLSKTKPKTISVFHNTIALELLGEGKPVSCSRGKATRARFDG